MRPGEAAAYLKVKQQTMGNWRKRGIGPAYVLLPGADPGMPRYRRSVLNAFVLVRQQQTSRLPALSRGAFPVTRYATGQQTSPPPGPGLPLAV